MIHTPYQPDQVVANRYVVTQVQRVAGMTALYQARHAETGALFAIKEEILQPDEGQSLGSLIHDFEFKTDLLKALDHPIIPKIHEGFVVEEQSYLVMSFVEGKDLEDILFETREFLPIPIVRRWAIDLADVLNYLHTRTPMPIIYRDLKPANIMIDPLNRVQLVDYGIAGVFAADEVYAPMGTDGYAAPEQYEGQVSPLVDMYALGATLHHVLTRIDPRLQPPFSFSKRSIRQINPSAPWPLIAIIMRALAYNPEDRFPNMAAMLDALRNIESEIG